MKRSNLPSGIIRDYGCLNCSWKFTGRCSLIDYDNVCDFTSLEPDSGGMCLSYRDHLLSLLDSCDSISSIRQKLNLYLVQDQCSGDMRDYYSLKSRYDSLRKSGVSSKELRSLQLAMYQSRTWQVRGQELLDKGYRGIADRESRSANVDKVINKIPLHQIHTLAKLGANHLEDGYKDE